MRSGGSTCQAIGRSEFRRVTPAFSSGLDDTIQIVDHKCFAGLRSVVALRWKLLAKASEVGDGLRTRV